LFFDGGVSATNPDAGIKSINLLTLSDDTTNQKLILIRSLDLAKSDSIKLDNLDGNKYKLRSFGTEKTYLLEMQLVSDAGLDRFRKSGLSLGFNTTHTIVPGWDDLQNSMLTILVDVGNDGTIDDTLHIVNELTGIDEDQGSLIPTEYKLEQNYPNPFNGSTVIKYSIVQEGLVTLKIYNAIGEEVAMLVNEIQQVGNYNVSFDMSSLPSGIYFYRLQAGNFIDTKKLMLLK
jgi:hypothetical protein